MSIEGLDKEKILRLYELSDGIFGTGGAGVLFKRPMRTGKRFLERELEGTDMNAYWPMTHGELIHPYKGKTSLAVGIDRTETGVSKALSLLPVDTDEVYRRTVVNRNRERNKPAPKKGQGKRTAKGKGKK
jgi:hypothetical protein